MAAITLYLPSASAKEGMFTPDQLPEIAEDLSDTGLRLDPATLTDLTAFPMGAVISLGGCTASFVSRSGLAVTNHHCARGSVQFNSTPEQNFLEEGFLANRFVDELPAAPGTRIYVTVDVQDVTERVRDGLDTIERGRDVYDAIENRRKEIVAECETQTGHRCQVASFYGGAQFKLIDRLEIKDVRLVYAPGDSIGKYGGDIDNWMWPRHTGDFAFYRAYVSADGLPAEYDLENVPFQPDHTLDVSASGLDDGDFVMVLGYPGRTSRYARLAEVRNTFAWQYPVWIDLLEGWIDAIETAAPEGSDARIKYESRLAGLNNFLKNLGGQIEGAERVGLLERRAERESALEAWARELDDGEAYLTAISQLDMLSEQMAAADRRAYWYDQVRRPQLLRTAQRLYRLAKEREKPDAQREPGYQDRDMAFFQQSLEALNRRFDPAVDKAEWIKFLEGYQSQPIAARISSYDRALGLSEAYDGTQLSLLLDGYYQVSTLGDLDTRLALMGADVETLEASEDPFMRMAVALYETDRALEEADEELTGRMARLRPAYMNAIRAWQADLGSTAYPDANSTLRVSYGTVMGPPDGGAAFTTLEEIVEKDTGEAPFNSPQAQLDAIALRDYGPFAMESIDTVPVNFLSDLDVTGGNSGSATLNADGELVGLLFDGTLESVNSDWDFDVETTRAIHVDSRYMLWVMSKIDGAERLVNEMNIIGLPGVSTPDPVIFDPALEEASGRVEPALEPAPSP
ncbi:MAG: S46 family peptidase [Pseudomonadota bacterium]